MGMGERVIICDDFYEILFLFFYLSGYLATLKPGNSFYLSVD